MAWVSSFPEGQGTQQCGVGVGVRHCRMPWTAQIVWLNPFVYQLMTLLAMRSTASVSDEATAGAGDEATAGDNAGSHWR